MGISRYRRRCRPRPRRHGTHPCHRERGSHNPSLGPELRRQLRVLTGSTAEVDEISWHPGGRISSILQSRPDDSHLGRLHRASPHDVGAGDSSHRSGLESRRQEVGSYHRRKPPDFRRVVDRMTGPEHRIIRAPRPDGAANGQAAADYLYVRSRRTCRAPVAKKAN